MIEPRPRGRPRKRKATGAEDVRLVVNIPAADMEWLDAAAAERALNPQFFLRSLIREARTGGLNSPVPIAGHAIALAEAPQRAARFVASASPPAPLDDIDALLAETIDAAPLGEALVVPAEGGDSSGEIVPIRRSGGRFEQSKL